MKRALTVGLVVAIAFGVLVRLDAQRGAAPASAQPPRSLAPIDLTGYWVSVVTMDWRWRMVTPAKGDYVGIPMTLEAKKVADLWDPAKDEAAGEQCRSYGAPAIMSVPGRLHITWQDDSALKVETDAGLQTRVLRFGATAAAAPARTEAKSAAAARTWQGVSQAQWQTSRANASNASLLLRPLTRSPGDAATTRNGSLKVITTGFRPGYLRKNGVPYSANAVLTEYWDVYKRPNGEEWLTVTTQIEDPLYLREPRLIAFPFKKEPNAAKWDPTPCSARW